GLIGDSPGDGLADPPRRIGREFVATAIVELVHGLHQANIAFLDQVQELQAPIRMSLGNRDDKPKIGFDKVALRILRVYIALNDLALSSMELLKCDVSCLFESLEVRRANLLRASAFSSNPFATRTLTFPFQVSNPAIQRAHCIRRCRHPVDQALALELRVPDAANRSGYRDYLAS